MLYSKYLENTCDSELTDRYYYFIDHVDTWNSFGYNFPDADKMLTLRK